MKIFVYLLVGLFFAVQAVADCTALDSSTNSYAPGTKIAALDGITESISGVCIKGASSNNEGNKKKDYYYFTVGTDGILNITTSSPNNHIYHLRIGSSKDGTEYYGDQTAKSHTVNPITLHAGDTVYLRLKETGRGKDKYQLNFNFIKKTADTSVGSNDFGNTGTCYAMSDDESSFYTVSMSPGANPLPVPIETSLDRKFNGEGSAYRALDKKLYVFQGVSDSSGPSNLYKIDVETGKIDLVKEALLDGAVDGAEFYYDVASKKEIFYVLSGENHSKIYAFDSTTWVLLDGYPKTVSGDTTGISSIAIDPVSGDAYGIDDYNYDNKKPKLYQIDLATGKTTFKVQLDQIADAEGLAYASDGNLYIEDEGYIDGRKIYKVDLVHGSLLPAAVLGGHGDIEGLSCNGTEITELEIEKPFTCSQDAYLFNKKNPSLVHTINLSDGSTSAVGQIASRFINGTGYNIKDNMIWGYDIENKKVIKIDADFNVTAYKVTALPDGNYYAGDVSSDGILYLKKHNDNKLYKIDLNSGIPTYLDSVNLKEGNSASSANFGDFAFSPKDNMLYGISEKEGNTYNHLYKINPETGKMTDLGVANPGVKVEYHTFVFDIDGNLYFYGSTGKIYRIKIAQGVYQAELFAQTDNKSAGGDGARCPLAKVEDPVSRNGICYAVDDTKNKFYSVYVDPEAASLPVAKNIPLDFSSLPESKRKKLDGEGGAFNSADGLVYVFHEGNSYPLLYVVNPATGQVSYVTKFETMKTNVVGASFYGGYFYVIAKNHDGNAVLYKIQTSDWTILSATNIHGDTTDADALAINTDAQAYIVTDNNKKIYKIDIKTAETQYVQRISLNTDAEGLSFAKDGNLYVENSEDGKSSDTDKLFRINLATGTLTPAAQIPHEDDIDIESLSCDTHAATTDDIVKLSVSDVKKYEGNNGLTDFTFTVHLSKPAPEGMGFWYTVTDGSDGDQSIYPGAVLSDDDMIGISGCVEASKDGTSKDIRGTHDENCAQIPIGSTSVLVHVNVKGDRKVEPDERFFFDIYSPDKAEIEDERAEGIILNDDHNISINAMTTDSGFDGNITTQVVGKPFFLILKAYDKETNTFIKDVNITSVNIVDENGNNVYQWEGVFKTNEFGIARLYNIVVNQAVKVASVKINASYEGTDYTDVVATDKFAVRPDHFVLDVPTPNIAGENFTIHLKAVKYGSSDPALKYNEEINTSFNVGYHEKLNSCQTAKIDLSSIAFTNGEVSKVFKYPEIGKVDFNISEIKGAEFAYVDANDTPDNQRLIREASANDIVFKPAKVVLNWSLKNGDVINNYTYFGNFDAYPDANNMAAALDINISVQNALGKVVKNFTDGCYANNIDMNLHYRLEGEKDTDYVMHTQYIDMNGTIRGDVTKLPVKLSMEGAFDSVNSNENVATNFWNSMSFMDLFSFSNNSSQSDPCPSAAAAENSSSVKQPTAEGIYSEYKMDTALFQEGIGVKIAKFNFERKADEPRNPMTFKILDINASFNDVPTEVSLTGSNKVTFLYARAHIPDQQIVGEKADIPVYYEVYCKDCDLSKYNLAGLYESKDSINWYILNSVNETYSNFIVPSSYNDTVVIPNGAVISNYRPSLKEVLHKNNKTMHIEVNKAPFAARIKYKPKSYLVFNRFKASADRHAFSVNFVPKKTKWAGKGGLGRTVDIAIAPKNNMNIIDW